MKQYGHIPAAPPPAQTADGGRRSPVTGAAVIAVRENPCRNTAGNLRMCESCINTHNVATRVKIRNFLRETMPCTLFSSTCKADILPIYLPLTFTAMPMFVSDTGTMFFGGSLLWLLSALVVLCLAVIIVLAVIVVRQRRQIASKNECIVRNASLYLGLIHKKDVPELSGRRPESELSQVELVGRCSTALP